MGIKWKQLVSVGLLSLVAMMFTGCGLFDASVDPNKIISAKSPEGLVEVVVDVNGSLDYQVFYQGNEVIGKSALGFEFENMDAMTEGFIIAGYTVEEFQETWEPVWGQRAVIDNHCNVLTLNLVEEKGAKRQLDLVFKVYDDGIGFRYMIPGQDSITDIVIMDELTEFVLMEDHTSWWIQNDWNSYEYLYKETRLSEVRDASTPITMKAANGTHISIHEAALIDYAGMALTRTEGLTLKAKLAPWPDNTKVKIQAPMQTPWRTIQLGENAGDLIESSLILNLNEPVAIEDTSWIQPMKYMGIWWEMHINKSDWGQHNNNHGATTDNAKYYIDFIAEYLTDEEGSGPIGFLVEGWNQGWDGNWMDNYDKFIFTVDGQYDDFNVEEVVAYGEARGVEYIMHNETSGGIENYEAQMDEAYADYQALSINAIKSGYVSDGGMQQPSGVSHHGQYMVNHYNHAVMKAADYELMINTHEPIKPTGLSRTYPNWVAREGVQGMEYNAWSDGNPPEHTTILPFTRILGGPIDYTPGIFDVEVGGRANRVHTTRAKQLALYVVLYSPLQMITDLPENYLDEEGNIYEEFQFVKDVAVDWQETKVLNAEIGDYVTIARQEKGGERWFIGSITDEEARELEAELSFLDQDKQYVATIYADAEGTDYLNHPNDVLTYQVLVDYEEVLHLSIPASGGVAITLTPATESDVSDVPIYTHEALNITELNMPTDIEANDAFVALVTVENRGSVVSSQPIGFYIDGELISETMMRVEPLSKKEIPFTYDSLFEQRSYEVKIGDFEPQQVTVHEKEPTLVYSEPEMFIKSGKLVVIVQVTNMGSSETSEAVACTVNGETIGVETIDIGAGPGGVTKGVRFNLEISEYGTYSVQINEEPAVDIEYKE